MAERTFAVATAGFWFNAAEKAKAEGKMQDAYLCMVNAFNHTENALYAARRGSLLAPAVKAVAPDASTPEGAKKVRENADHYRETLKPFA
jgi:hypothetical protein